MASPSSPTSSSETHDKRSIPVGTRREGSHQLPVDTTSAFEIWHVQLNDRAGLRRASLPRCCSPTARHSTTGTASITPATRALVRQSNVAYNRRLVDFCAPAPGRLCGLAAIDFDDVDQAVADVQWAKDHGLGGVPMPPLHPDGKYFFDPVLDPIWAACVDVGFALSQHGGTGAPNYARRASRRSWCSRPSTRSSRADRFGNSSSAACSTASQKLKIAYVESESWWIAPVLQLLDRRETMGDD
jgi:hypothetical protein